MNTDTPVRYYVYYLRRDAIDGSVFYVGRTTDPARRFNQHRNDHTASPKRDVLLSLKESGSVPILDVVFETEDADEAIREENRHIALNTANGLTNNHTGRNNPLHKEAERAGTTKRFQMYIDILQWDKLWDMSKSDGLSIAEHIRRAIDQYLKGF